jgi:acyl-coenzyme A synthetase/AMP-(fatty) acid ligase
MDNPCPTPFNMAAHVLQHAAALGDKPALEMLYPDHKQVWTYGRLDRAVRGIGTGLLARGLVPGDRVLLRLGNSASFPLAFLGAIAVGMVPVPVSAQWTAIEVASVTRWLAPKLVIAASDLPLPAFEQAVVTEADLLAWQALAPCDFAMCPAERPAYIVFTSGTSGKSTGVLHAHRAVWARRMMHQGWQGLRQDDRLLHAGAMNWTFTLGAGLCDPWACGATALIPAPATSAAALGPLLAQHNATIFAAVPGVFRQVLRAGLPSLPRLRHGLTAGETMPDTLRLAWRNVTGTDVHEALGMTECSTFLSASPMRPAPLGRIGFAQGGRRLEVLDDKGNPASLGELAVHSSDPGLMLGYLGENGFTPPPLQAGWFMTGDTVSRLPDGSFCHTGRKDDLLNPGGFRVSPQEIEAQLITMPGIEDCAVTEVKVAPGASVLACGYIGQPLAEADLSAHAALRLARYKQPRLWFHLDLLPRNRNMKLDRRAMRAILQERFDGTA